MKYLTVKELSEMWEISGTMIRKYCTQGRIPGARQGALGWEIPENAKKPKAKAPSSSRYDNLPKLARLPALCWPYFICLHSLWNTPPLS